MTIAFPLSIFKAEETSERARRQVAPLHLSDATAKQSRCLACVQFNQIQRIESHLGRQAKALRA